jgi:translation initiation factor IF-3
LPRRGCRNRAWRCHSLPVPLEENPLSNFPRRPPNREPQGPRINDRIRISPIRLIDENGEMVGVVELDEAKRRAYDAGYDLVEVAPDVRPPVVRIMDYGKYKYEQAKKDKASKSKSKSSEMKEVRLGRSMKIDPHDVDIRIKQARQFLIEGHRVQIVQNFKGRELAHKSRGDVRMAEVAERLSDLGKVEVEPRLAGKRMTMIIIPDRQRVEAFKRKEAQEAKAAGRAPTSAEPAASSPPEQDEDVSVPAETAEARSAE